MIFRFKQFKVDQTGCAMKINTDGVLLGALVKAEQPKAILDIGTGTGVIALMLAQRFPQAAVDAVEIAPAAAETAGNNFKAAPFYNRPVIYPMAFEAYFAAHPEGRYDVLVSNPPFHLNSLAAATEQKNLAKHTGELFFEELLWAAAQHLTATGTCWLVLPLATSVLVKRLAIKNELFVNHIITIHSFAANDAHREIIALSRKETKRITERFVIYDAPKVYSRQYEECLKEFFILF